MARIPLGLTGLIVAGSQITPSLSARPWGMWTTYLSPELRILGEAHRRGKPSTYRMVHLRRRVTNTPCDDMPDDSGQPVAIPPEAVNGGRGSFREPRFVQTTDSQTNPTVSWICNVANSVTYRDVPPRGPLNRNRGDVGNGNQNSAIP